MTRRKAKKPSKSKREMQWDSAYQLLLKFVAREGHATVPTNHVEKGFKLGSWIIQPRSYQKKMSLERHGALESLRGWKWRPYEERWNKAYQKLVQFVEREGHSRVPYDHWEERLGISAGMDLVLRDAPNGMS